MDEKEMQQKYLEMQIIEQQMKEYQNELTALQLQINEMENLRESLEEIEKAKEKNEILTALSPGVFIKTQLKGKNILMNVGYGVVVPKDVKEALGIVKDQTMKMQGIVYKLEKDVEIFNKHLINLQMELQELLNKK